MNVYCALAHTRMCGREKKPHTTHTKPQPKKKQEQMQMLPGPALFHARDSTAGLTQRTGSAAKGSWN